jgi:hypothetical protein
VNEFKATVKALHVAGLEVIIDVVYNHTAEGNHLGPTLSMKGIDNPSYYRLVDEDRSFYFDTTGTGNSFNVGHAAALRLIMDSLRYWVTEMHVDGFRFDLATTLTRQYGDLDIHSAFLDMVEQDPVPAPGHKTSRACGLASCSSASPVSRARYILAGRAAEQIAAGRQPWPLRSPLSSQRRRTATGDPYAWYRGRDRVPLVVKIEAEHISSVP